MITQKGREAKPTILTSVVNALLSVAKAKRALSQIFKLQHCMTVSAQPPGSAGNSRLEAKDNSVVSACVDTIKP